MMSAIAHDASSNDVWYVDLGVCNHITCHHTWFNEMKEPSKPGYVETGDDTMHSIQHVGNVPLTTNDGRNK